MSRLAVPNLEPDTSSTARSAWATAAVLMEYSIKKAAVANTEKAVLLVAGSKFGTTSLLIYAGLDKFQTVVTDSRIPPAYRQRLRDLHIDLRIVEDAAGEG